MRIKAVTLGFVLAGTALGSSALNLGRARGAAWIGQPLELLVPMQIDTSQPDGALCPEADVFHGDSRQDSSRVQVQAIPTDAPDTFNLKITSSTPIDEPVVTVYLRAGCTQKFSRKYVLLAEFPSDAGAPSGRTAPSATPQVPLVVPATAVKAPAVAAPGKTKPAATAPDATKPGKPTLAAKAEIEPAHTVAAELANTPPSKKDGAAKVEKSAQSAKTAEAGKPRLRLDPVETLNERIKSLESTTTGNTPHADAARGSEKMELLQSDLKTLLDQAAKNEASLMAMRERLERAESDRVPISMVYGLGGLVALCMAALAFMWSRRPRYADFANFVQPSNAAAEHASYMQSDMDTTSHEDHFDVNTEDMDQASFDALMADQSGPQKTIPPSKVAEIHSAGTVPRSDFNADYLVDLRQQAEFLAQLGKTDEAIATLEDGIHSNPKESPLLFMDLLVITHNAGRENDFELCRQHFTSLFNVAVPQFPLLHEEGQSLNSYPALLEHINAQWESPDVMDIVQACILRSPEVRASEPYDLSAFRELVNLHGVASEYHNRNRS